MNLLDGNESHEVAGYEVAGWYIRAYEWVEAMLQGHEPGVAAQPVEGVQSHVAQWAAAVGAGQVEVGHQQPGVQGCEGGWSWQ